MYQIIESNVDGKIVLNQSETIAQMIHYIQKNRDELFGWIYYDGQTELYKEIVDSINHLKDEKDINNLFKKIESNDHWELTLIKLNN